MADDQYLAEPAARHMQKPSLRQRLAAPKDAANASRIGASQIGNGQDPLLSTSTIHDKAPLPRDKTFQRKRRIALVITVLVALAIPSLLFALIFAS